ncbi:MAG: hypothetical protein OXI55_07005 [Gammaproteobacteria bacterium]|nr:hypothetical protein [Gammaproteobacteria bacterium]
MADRERITRVLAAIASTPIGFVVGAVAGARLASTTEGVALLACGFAGASLFAVATLGLARFLAGRRLLALALALGASSFALLAFMVEDYIAERIRAANAFDAHYATLPHFELSLHHVDPTREPLSRFAFDATSLEFNATRPGNWHCTGKASRKEKAELHAALQDMPVVAPTPPCSTTVKWQVADSPPGSSSEGRPLVLPRAEGSSSEGKPLPLARPGGRVGSSAGAELLSPTAEGASSTLRKKEGSSCDDGMLISIADAIVKAHERRTRCRRGP